MTKELDSTATGDFSRGQAESEAAVNAQQGAHDAALWARQSAEAAQRASAALAKATRAQQGGGA